MRPLIKICGLTRRCDVEAAVAAGANAVGFVCVAASRRGVTRDLLAELTRDLPREVKKVGVFVDAPLTYIRDMAAAGALDVVQLHGGESPEFAAAIDFAEVWKAVRLECAADVEAAAAYPAAMLLADSAAGGSGECCDWEWAAALAKRRPLWLAGGLTRENVAAAIRQVKPAGVDCASGVESMPGIKDSKKIKAFFTAIKGVNQMDTHYGIYGGQYVAETLMPTLLELEKSYLAAKADPAFQQELAGLLADYVGRESPLYEAKRLSDYAGGARIFLKREDLNHTGAHKVNNTVGQVLLARRMGKKRLIAETGAGMHGVATATVAALFGMPCDVYMGAIDVERQAANVERMKVLGARVIAVSAGSATLKDAMNEAIRDWAATAEDTFYVIGTVAGPHPYPAMVRDFQAVIGEEARRQCLAKTGRLPDEVVACVGGGSNAMGLFAGFIADPTVKLTGAEAAGEGVDTGRHAASICGGRVGVLHGSKSYLLQDEDGQIMDTYSVSAGLDYPGVGPEHCQLADTGRARYLPITDAEAIEAFELLSRLEGIIPALESSHAVAQGIKSAAAYGADGIVIVNLSGRGDKDMASVRRYRQEHPAK